MAIISIVLLGVIVWNFYQSFIISGLANLKVQYPFTDLEGLSKSSYFLTSSSSKRSATTIRFTKPVPGSVEEKIFINNMDIDKSFTGGSKGLNLVHKEPRRAHFAKSIYMKQVQKKLNIPFCDLLHAWKSKNKIFGQMVTRKDFKHFESLENLMIRLLESGHIARLQKSYNKEPSIKGCIPEVAPVGMDKLGSLFIMLGTAFFISFGLFFIEYLKTQLKKIPHSIRN